MNLPAKTDQTALATREDDPEAQLQWAEKCANALMHRVRDPLIMNGRKYLQVGQWQMLGSFFGATVGIEWSREMVRNGEAIGYEAHAVVLRNGQEIASADSQCLRSEPKWNSRWNKRKGESEPVPEFQLRSMAQTRACSKALRNAYGWVAELAGYESTPAEEMDGDREGADPPPPRRQYTRRAETNLSTGKRTVEEHKLPVDKPADTTSAESATPAATDNASGGVPPLPAGGTVGTKENLFHMARLAAEKGSHFFKKSFYQMRSADEQEQMLEIGLELRIMMNEADDKLSKEMDNFTR